jgi:hypothetical protein
MAYHVLSKLDDHVHEVLPRVLSAEVERHCAECATCHAALIEARARKTALEAALPPVEASPELVERAQQHVERHLASDRRWRRRVVWSGLGLAASLLAALIGLHVYTANLAPNRYDLVLVGQRELPIGAPSALRVQVVDSRAQRAAVPGVPVKVELLDQAGARIATLAEFTTDANGNGQPRFTPPDWPNGEYTLLFTAKTPDGVESMVRSVRLTRPAKLLLTSDKPVYQPGQEIHLRALALRQPDLHPVAEQPAVFSIADPQGNIVFKREAKTSRFGIVAADCPLAEELLEGAYRIACKVGDSESDLSVEVKRYVLPRFKIEIAFDRPFYQPGETGRASVRARYFHGEPLRAASVTPSLVEGEGEAGPRPLAPVQTDAYGEAVVLFVAPNAGSRFQLRADVADGAGQKETAGAVRVLAAQPLQIALYPEGGDLVPGVLNHVFVRLTLPDGSPAADVRLTATGVEEELRTNRDGFAFFETNPRGEAVKFLVRALSKNGVEITSLLQELRCGAKREELLLRPEKTVYRTGEELKLKVLSPNMSGPVFFDLIRPGEATQTLVSDSIDAATGENDARLRLPPEASGAIEVCAYRPAAGAWLRKSRLIYVLPRGELKVSARMASSQHRPGGDAKIDFTLTGDDGRPAVGALSLSAVDEAVFSVLPQKLGLEKRFFLSDASVVKDVYSLAPQWTPGVQDDPRRDEALFAAASTSSETSSRSPHSLSGDDHAAKAAAMDQLRRERLGVIRVGWAGWFGLLLVLAYGGLWLCLPRKHIVTFQLTFLVFIPLVSVVAVCLPILMLGTRHSGVEAFGVFGGGFQPPAAAEAAAKVDEPVPQRVEHAADPGKNPPASIRVRESFPETLLWRPEAITDEQGRYTLDLKLADSITTWKLAASAVSADGRFGDAALDVAVRQDFFVEPSLPVALTRNDEVEIPVVVHNELTERQTVKIKLTEAAWFSCRDGEQSVVLGPGEVKSARFRVKALKVGKQTLHVAAASERFADAVKRPLEVLPDGRRVEQTTNGSLNQPADLHLTVPDTAVEGSVRAYLKLYPSAFSQLVEGLDGVFQLPSGCFEQTSSTTYPNVLALDYLRKTRQAKPELEARAQRFIQTGYQRLLSFEVAGGGFDWYGKGPANVRLTAYGLMEFSDMARVHEVDPKLLERTRRWLLAQQHGDGSWSEQPDGVGRPVFRPNQVGPQGVPAPGPAANALLSTAYVAWAVFGAGGDREQARPALEYLLLHRPSDIQDIYTLALVCNALLAISPDDDVASPYLDVLEARKQAVGDGKLLYWSQVGVRTSFEGAGTSGNIEATALATLALLRAKRSPGTTSQALAWLVSQKDPNGAWHSTQATVLTLKALMFAGQPSEAKERRIEVRLGKDYRKEIVLKPDQADVLHIEDLTPQLTTGSQRLTLTDRSGSAVGYQVAFRYHVPETEAAGKPTLKIDLHYDRQTATVGDALTATVQVQNAMAEPARMVMLELPTPPGFRADVEELNRAVEQRTVDKVEVQPQRVVVYLRGLQVGQTLPLSYRLEARTPATVTAGAGRVYEYYAPERQGFSTPTRLTIEARR